MEQPSSRQAQNEAIRRISLELDKIRARLGALGDEDRKEPEAIEDDAPATNIETAVLLATARRIQRVRQRRQRHLPAELLGEPAWDILIDLYIASRTGKRLAVSAVCVGAMVPATTALRHIRTLVGRGIVHREADVTDGRRVWLSLPPRVIRSMECCLAEAAQDMPS